MKYRITINAPVACKRIVCLVFLTLVGISSTASSTQADEPKWYPYVVARGQDRVIIQNTPVMQRPYRPMHFYGNAVRRTYYRGNPALRPRDVARATSTILRR